MGHGGRVDRSAADHLITGAGAVELPTFESAGLSAHRHADNGTPEKTQVYCRPPEHAQTLHSFSVEETSVSRLSIHRRKGRPLFWKEGEGGGLPPRMPHRSQGVSKWQAPLTQTHEAVLCFRGSYAADEGDLVRKTRGLGLPLAQALATRVCARRYAHPSPQKSPRIHRPAYRGCRNSLHLAVTRSVGLSTTHRSPRCSMEGRVCRAVSEESTCNVYWGLSRVARRRPLAEWVPSGRLPT